MTRLMRWVTVAALALASGPASAQPESGALTVLSRPNGAAFRLLGEQGIVGRTPMTLARGLSGRYVLQSAEPGYEPFRRSIVLDGLRADTVWMALRAKQPWSAAMRSLVLPGAGQFYSGRSNSGWTYLIATAAAAGAFAVTAQRYQQRVDDYDQADARYQAAATVGEVAAAFEARRKASQDAEDAYDLRQIALGVTAGVWALGALDAMFLFPRYGGGPLWMGVETRPGPDGRPQAVALARVEF
jgi:hypothetical protein